MKSGSLDSIFCKEPEHLLGIVIWTLELKLLKISVSCMFPRKSSLVSWTHKDTEYIINTAMRPSKLCLLKGRRTAKNSNPLQTDEKPV